MTGESEREVERIRAAYQRRADLGLDARYGYWEPANLFTYQSRERAFLSLLRRHGLLPLSGRRVLDVGCGAGGVLLDLLRYGLTPSAAVGVDLLPARIEQATKLLPGADLRVADAQALPLEDAAFDLVLGFTLLSSVLAERARARIAAEICRVTRPGGLIIIYDFWINPFNRDVRPLRRNEVRALFAGRGLTFAGVTLAPPVARALAPHPGGWLACTLLEMLPFLKTHFLAAISP